MSVQQLVYENLILEYSIQNVQIQENNKSTTMQYKVFTIEAPELRHGSILSCGSSSRSVR